MLYQKSYISRVQASIISQFVSRLKDKFTINSIAKELKKPYPLVHRNIGMLLKRNLVSKDEHGLLSLSRNADVNKLAYVESLRRDAFLEKHKELKIIINDLMGINADYFTLLMFGSYTSGKSSKGSDIDLLLIIDKGIRPLTYEAKSRIEGDVERIASRFSRKIHTVVLITTSIYEMLQKSNENNVMNETLNNHIIFFGAESYHRMVQNAG